MPINDWLPQRFSNSMARVSRVLFLVGIVLRSSKGRSNTDTGHAGSSRPRYVLCDNAARSPTAKFASHTVRVFAASVSSVDGEAHTRPGRPRMPLSLHAALLLDGPAAWRTAMATHADHNDDDGHAKDVSYSKCFGHVLPYNAKISCLVLHGRVPGNSSHDGWGEGRLSRFRNKELEQDVAQCVLGAPTRRWRHSPGPPRRLYMRLAIETPELRRPAIVPLELCRVQQPLKRISFCSQPLYGVHRLQQELRWVIDDWLSYHLDHLGFEHAELYDIDGSLAAPLERWLRRGRVTGGVRYRASWPANLSSSLAAHSRHHPYCAETYAYAHCITTHRALSRWVMFLHAPDEYVMAPGHRERGILGHLIARLESQLPEDEAFGMMKVRASSFARGGGDTGRPLATEKERGGVVAMSQLRSDLRYYHTPVIDPSVCSCAGPHACYAEAGAEFPALAEEVNPERLVVHHYVEMLACNHGRCASQHKLCDVPDSSATWLVPLLRAL